MLNTKLNEKSALARLLATENLSVQYSAKYPTAFFDLKSRTIHIPLIPNLDEDLLDLFEGHEVGHARETPAEGFHNAIRENGDISETFKTYLNVIEDIRIERKIKAEYPGLRRSFANAYKKLTNQNFFGEDLQARINTMDFIDKLNVEAKVGAYVLVDFDDEEKALVEEAYSLETWDEVVAFAKKLIGKQAKKNKEQQDQGKQEGGVKGMVIGDGQTDGESQENQEESESPESGDDTETNSSAESEGDSEDSNGNDASDDNESVAPSQTDQSFRQKEQEMFANSKKNDRYYNDGGSASITIGKYNLDEYVVPANKLSPLIDAGARQMFNSYVEQHKNDVYSSNTVPVSSYDEMLNQMYAEYRNDNQSYINFLIKEFEMRKNARMLNRGKISKTGKIDVSRLHKYRLSDDIFKRVMSFPEGKNHGMIMYMDLSGSMSGVINGVFNQILILSEFCKKVNIPFRVYGFSDAEVSLQFIRGNIDPKFGTVHSDAKFGAFKMKANFHLKEYISSELNARDYKTAFNNILMLKAFYDANAVLHRNRGRASPEEYMKYNQIYFSIDLKKIGEQLSATPLNEAVVLSQQISNEFVAKHNIENMVNIFLSDGEDDHANNILFWMDRSAYGGINDGYINRACKNPSLITHHSGTRYIIRPGECTAGFSTYHLLKMARKVTGARYIGYYLADSTSFLYNATSHDVTTYGNLDWKSHHSALKSKYRKDKFLHSTTYGYNDYFYISSTGTINDTDDDDEWFDSLSKRHNGNVTNKSLTKGFIDKQTKKQLNRILLVHFGKALAEAA